MKRRDLLKKGLAVSVAGMAGLELTTGGAIAAQAGARPDGIAGNGRAPGPDGRRRPVRNIIFFAYDGFNYEDLAVARYFSLRNGAGPLHIERLLGAGAAGSMTTHSLTSVVTDSAAATSAWAAGRKVVNGALSMYPDGRPLTTILELARDAGKATGLVTTTRLTHATPAGWIAKTTDRGLEDDIALQYFDFRPHVLLGGGSGHFTAGGREDGRDLEADFRQAGYQVLREVADLERVRGDRLLGAFTEGHLPYEIDRRFQSLPGPSLAQITRAGLAVLDRQPGGFVLQIEAGRIDHANHAHDPGGSLWDVLAADEALALVLDYVDRTPDTLLLMASDHATGGQVAFGAGPAYNLSTQALQLLGRRRASYSYLRSVLPRRPTAEQVRDGVHSYFGISLNGNQAEEGARVLARELRLGHRDAHSLQPANSFNAVVSQSTPGDLDRANVHFATGAHTAGLVPVAAYGAWDGPANLGVVDNTELFGWMASALGTDFRNPEMSEDEALRLTASAPPRPMAVL